MSEFEKRVLEALAARAVRPSAALNPAGMLGAYSSFTAHLPFFDVLRLASVAAAWGALEGLPVSISLDSLGRRRVRLERMRLWLAAIVAVVTVTVVATAWLSIPALADLMTLTEALLGPTISWGSVGWWSFEPLSVLQGLALGLMCAGLAARLGRDLALKWPSTRRRARVRGAGSRREELALFEALTAQMAEASLVVDQQGRISQANLPARRMIGSESCVIGTSLLEWAVSSGIRYLDGRPVPAEGLALSRALRGQTIQGEEYLRRDPRTGHDRAWRISTAPVRRSDESVGGVLLIATDITQQWSAEQALRESEASFRAIFEHSPLGMLRFDPDGRILEVNQALAQGLGFAPDELLGRHFIELFGPSERRRHLGQYRDLIAGKLPWIQIEGPIHGRDHQRRWSKVAVSGVRDADGCLRFGMAIQEDITARKLDELRSARLQRLTAVLNQINALMVRAEDPQALLDEACRLVVHHGPFKLAWIGMLEPDGCTIRPVAQHGSTRREFTLPITASGDAASGRCTTGTAIRTGSHDVCPDVEREDRLAPWREDLLAQGCRSVGAFPLRVDDRVVGALTVWSETSDGFEPESVAVLDRLVGDLGSALEAAEQAQRLRLHQTLLESQAESSPDGIAMVGLDGRFQVLNRRFFELWNIPPDRMDVVDHAHLRATMGSQIVDAQGWLDWLDHLYSHPEVRGSRELALLDGRFIEVISVPTIGPDETLCGRTWINRDVTERRLAEKQREAMQRSEKLRALGQLASGVAHDLNQFLGLVAGHGALALEAIDELEAAPAELRDSLEIVVQAALDGAESVKRLQTFARPEHGGPAARLKVVDLLNEVAQLTAPRWRDLAQQQGRPITLRVLADGDAVVDGQPSALREALTNLIFNAIDALPDGGRITLNARRLFERVEVAVTDSGVGMSAEVQARIFEPYFSTKGDRGTGLGLAMVYGIVQQHGGEVKVASAPGRGTTIALTFPLPGPRGQDRPARALDGPAIGPLRILSVDDVPTISVLIRRVLEKAGHSVAVVSSGEAALDALGAEPFDLLISDIGLGEGLNGWDLVEAAHEHDPELAVILVTGWGAAIDPLEARRHGIRAVLPKPFQPVDLLRAVNAAFDEGALSQDAPRAPAA